MRVAIVLMLSGFLCMSSGAYAPAAGQTKENSGSPTPMLPGMKGHEMMMGPGLMMPTMDSKNGRMLFASKGCVVCHSINGIGGKDAPTFDASSMVLPMNPFEFAARMWDGAKAMVALQREELGEPINLTGNDLTDIIAFVHDGDEQKKFSKSDIPPRIMDVMMKMEME